MSIMEQQFALLREAANYLSASDVAPYFKLKHLQYSQNGHDRSEFRQLFSRFYGLNAGGLTDDFKNRYFELLFSLRLAPNLEPPYADLLKELYGFRRRKGDQVIAVSFVSKLVAMHDESRPLYDRHVRNFFGIGKPALGSVIFQTEGFIHNLGIIRSQYENWSADPNFKTMINHLLKKIPQLKDCHPNRVCDFLVWTAGRRKLGSSKSVDEV